MNLVKWFTTWKYRWDLATSFLVFINFALLVIASSDKVQTAVKQLFGITVDLYMMSLIMLIGAFITIIVAGYILDRYIKYAHHMTSTSNERNKELIEILENTRQMKKDIEEIKNGSSYKK